MMQVVVRNYADMLWSAYNFWCDRVFDGVHCNARHWVEPGVNFRSPQHFHDVVNGDSNITFVPSPLFIKKPCHNAAYYYSDYLKFQLWRHFPRNMTLVVASEELETAPDRVWTRVATLLDYRQRVPQRLIPVLGNFSSIRVNSQDHKGGSEAVTVSVYRRGVYAVSGYQPMLDDTRRLLEKCWRRDCAFVSQVTGYLYPACLNESLTLIQTGGWHGFESVYRSSIHHIDNNALHDPID